MTSPSNRKGARGGAAARHPMQPLVRDEQGVIRFKENKIVRYLLDNNGKPKRIDLNELAEHGFPLDEWTQFAQLIGYSVSGWDSLSYVSDADSARARRKVREFVAAEPRQRPGGKQK